MLSIRARVIIDWLALISFALVAITGIALILYPHEGPHRGWHAAETFIPLSHTYILQIHIWAGIAFIVLCAIHIATNWNCLKNMTRAATGK